MLPHVSFVDVEAAAERIAPHVHRTPLLRSSTLDQRLGASVVFKYEAFQKIGAFKARGATNAVLSLDADGAAAGVITHSSGNHGAALAYAAGIRGVPCTVVMPDVSPQVKIEAVEGYGAEVVLCDIADRVEVAQAEAAERGATFIHPFDNVDVIAGQGTAALELIEDRPDLDIVVAPIGGGGLLSGTTVTMREVAPHVAVWGAEPEQVDDAHRSLEIGERQPAPVPNTIADGLRTGIGQLTFDILHAAGVRVLTVSEQEIIDAALFHLHYMKTVVEPSGAVGLAALPKLGDALAGASIGVIVSGGNTDFSWLPR